MVARRYTANVVDRHEWVRLSTDFLYQLPRSVTIDVSGGGDRLFGLENQPILRIYNVQSVVRDVFGVGPFQIANI